MCVLATDILVEEDRKTIDFHLSLNHHHNALLINNVCNRRLETAVNEIEKIRTSSSDGGSIYARTRRRNVIRLLISTEKERHQDLDFSKENE